MSSVSYYRVRVDNIGKPVKLIIANIDTSTTGIKQTYTVPTGYIAVVRLVSIEIKSGTPTIDITLTKGANTYRLDRFTSSGGGETFLVLESGDTLNVEVSTAGGVGSNADINIDGERLPNYTV